MVVIPRERGVTGENARPEPEYMDGRRELCLRFLWVSQNETAKSQYKVNCYAQKAIQTARRL